MHRCDHRLGAALQGADGILVQTDQPLHDDALAGHVVGLGQLLAQVHHVVEVDAGGEVLPGGRNHDCPAIGICGEPFEALLDLPEDYRMLQSPLFTGGLHLHPHLLVDGVELGGTM